MTDPKRPKAAELPPRIRDALPRILGRHAPAHALEAAFPMPEAGREKYIVRAFGLETPLLLRVYEVSERDRLENAVVMSRALKGEAPSYTVGGFDETGRDGPFLYTLTEMLWGTDAASLLEAEAVNHEDVRLLGVALGGAAGAIHGVTARGFGEPRLAAHQREDSLSTAVLHMIEDGMRAAQTERQIETGAFERLGSVTGPLFDLLDNDPAAATLVHGRLDMSSLIVKKDEGRYRLVGVVRLSGARFLDPAWDLAGLEADVFPYYPALRDPFYLSYTARRKLGPDHERKVELYRAIREMLP